jgi:carboxylesterase
MTGGSLVLHGFTGSTQSISYLGEELHRRVGFTVSAPRLAGHGTSPDDMETTAQLFAGSCSIARRTRVD